MIQAALYRVEPGDVRRGGVVLAIDDGLAFDARGFCDGMADEGYEMLVVPAPACAIGLAALRAPAFLLSLGAAGLQAWRAACSAAPPAAASLYDPPLSVLGSGEPGCPTALHLSGPRTAWPSHLEALVERRTDVWAFPYLQSLSLPLDGSDAARLARLRTLQLFHRASGVRGEMGGG